MACPLLQQHWAGVGVAAGPKGPKTLAWPKAAALNTADPKAVAQTWHRRAQSQARSSDAVPRHLGCAPESSLHSNHPLDIA